MDNFFQSGRRPIKVYIFGKLSSRAFQKYILLWVYDHSEESYPVMAALMLVISKITSYFDTYNGKVDQKNKRIYELPHESEKSYRTFQASKKS